MSLMGVLWCSLLLGTMYIEVVCADIKGPPRLLSDRRSTEKNVASGKDVKLSCPVTGNPNPIYEWAKASQSISEGGWGARYRLQGRQLRIKGTTPLDSGRFVCTAVNGFGSTNFTFILTVTEPMSSSSSSKSRGGKPRIEQRVPSPGIVTKASGHSIRLRCYASGEPKPNILWYKDGEELTEFNVGVEASIQMESVHSTGYADGLIDSRVTDSVFESRVTRSSLHLTHLNQRDSGNYTCVAHNVHGPITVTWSLHVIDSSSPPPFFSQMELGNETVQAGESATLSCRGPWNEHIKPKIMWLRELAEAQARLVPTNETVRYKGKTYRVMQPTQVLNLKDGSFVTKFVISKASVEDSGIYVCTATDKFGLNFRQASLNVLAPAGPELNTLLLVGGLVVSVLLMLGVGAFVNIRRRSFKPPPPPPTPSERSLLPQGHPIGQGKLQPALPIQPRYVAHPPLPLPPHGSPSEPPLGHMASVVHMPPANQGGQPIIVYQDPPSSASVYLASRPPGSSSTGRQEYQYQHLDVI